MSLAAHLSHPAQQALGRWESTSGLENQPVTRSGQRLWPIWSAKRNRFRIVDEGFLSGGSQMIEEVDLYKTQYVHAREQIYEQIRAATYGHDLGQSSWITLEEAQRFLGWLNLSPASNVLEIACGAGGFSCLIHERFDAKVHGVDISPEAVHAAGIRCEGQGLTEKVTFSVRDASKSLDFPDESFDAVFCNDSINHLPARESVFQEWWRILKPNGKALFTDPIVVTGILSNEEIRVRSSIGYYLFTPKGENEHLLETTGFQIMMVEDVTGQVEQVSKLWYDARQLRKEWLLKFEELNQFEALQNFLDVVHVLATEKRLSRFAYLAYKQA
jgi:ubiquinone/menaquinone biosynthesis C-methylase UbiE